MSSDPILMARPSSVNSERNISANGNTNGTADANGAPTKPYKSILLKRKLDDRPDSEDRDADKRRRVTSGSSRDYQEIENIENGSGSGNGSPSSSGEDYDLDEGVALVRPKKQKTKSVTFDMNLNITTEVGRRTLQETKILVRRALQGNSAKSQDYIELVDVFSHDKEPYRDPSIANGTSRKKRAGDSNGDDSDDEDGNMVRPDDLVLYVVALAGCAPMLNKSCISLVRKLLECSWIGRDDKFVRAYVQFLSALVSAQGGNLRSVLEMIVDWFKEPSPSSWTVPDFPTVSVEEVQGRLHFALRQMLRLFPASRLIVCKLMNSKFPFPAESKNVHMYYVDNMLKLRAYAPTMAADILETITSNLVKIDTEFQLDLSDMDDELVSRVMYQLARKDMKKAKNTYGNGKDKGYERDNEGESSESDEDDNDDVDSVASEEDDEDDEDDDDDVPQIGEPGYDEEVARIDKSTKLVQKLDFILDRLFELFTPVFEDPDSEAARECLQDMMSDFANFVLTVPSSRHTQFLIFHFSQKSLALQDIFTGTLLNLGFESNRPAAVRQSAAAYLSSYVARAARVPRETVRDVATILCHRIEAYRQRNSDACRGPDLRRYQELYSWVQALLYIFCFRWRDLIDSYPEDLVDPEDPASFVGKDLDWMVDLKPALSSIIHAKFNPLMVCSPPIVAEFAKLAHSLRFMYVFPRIASNKSIHLSQFASGRYMHGDALREDAGYAVDDDSKWLQLEGNFPFDPYNLPVSKRWLEGDYVAWTPIPGLGDDDDDDDSSDSSDDDDDDVCAPEIDDDISDDNFEEDA